VEVGGAAFLGFDGAEVLHVPADTAPGVLPEPIQQRREVDRIAGGPPVVIAIWVYRRPATINPPVGIQGEGEEGGGAVTPGEYPPDGAALHGSARQVRGILPTASRTLHRLGWGIERGESAAYAESAEFGVEFGD
jgi:hypothetical protein